MIFNVHGAVCLKIGVTYRYLALLTVMKRFLYMARKRASVDGGALSFGSEFQPRMNSDEHGYGTPEAGLKIEN